MFHVEHSTKFFDVFSVSRGTYPAQFFGIVDKSLQNVDFLLVFAKIGNFYVDNYPKFFSKFSGNPLI